MKFMQAPVWIFTALFSIPAFAQVSSSSGSADASQAVRTAESAPVTPAQQRIESAQLQIQANPKKTQAFQELTTAYLKRARETSNTRYLYEAEDALQRGLKLDGNDFQLQRTEVALLLARHQFVEADKRARLLNQRTPDDVMTYGYMAEAEIALGNYKDAESSTQWMLNMRPNNIPGLTIGAKLRVLYGDSSGALQFLNLAYAETSPNETEDQAWIANQMASIDIDTGRADAAETILKRSGQLFPQYPPTLENLARIRMVQHRDGEAITLLQQARQIDDDPHTLYLLGKAQMDAGNTTEAQATLAEFRKAAMQPAERTSYLPGRVACDLILLDAEDAAHRTEAKELAGRRIQTYQDVWTLDADAWALYANGEVQPADAAIQKAIAVGIQSAQIFDHAGHIAHAMHREADAAKYFELSVRSDPASAFGTDASKFMDASQRTAVEALTAIAPMPVEASKAVSTAPLRLPQAEFALTAPAFAPVPQNLLVPHLTETDRIIRKTQALISADPANAGGYAALGAAHFQRARETGDVSDYEMAEKSLAKSLDLVPADFSSAEALGTLAEVCMGEHRFEDALNYSQRSLSLGTGDVSPFAIVGDAYADMGEYEKARAAYARLTPPEMTLSPRAAYARDSRLAYLKFISGDTAGAVQLMKTSVAEGVEAQLPSENLAWLYYELGEFYTQGGEAALADAAYLAALTAHPGDYRALAGMAKLRANLGKYKEAIVLYQRAIAVVPMPIFVAELGDLYAKSGNAAEAQKQYQLVEYIGLLGHINQVLHNRDLALFYADHDIKLTESLQLAQKELEVRHDIYTWDALAWALYKNGRYAEAQEASDKALRFGTKDALLLYHAGVIAERSGRPDQARNDLKEALLINPHFHLTYADLAQQKLLLPATQAASIPGMNAHVN